ncbi:hypothetical protein ACFY0F_23565 [Streptomyces sp. NPDC001544]|uniref:hypothetical protein n=1 Tax=Streptomyces sp. NPDC001544 TaxID=3364584 RepID=UPI0036C79EEE
MTVEVKVIAMTLNDLPYGCPECGTAALTLDGRSIFDGFPAWGCCSNYHSWEDRFLTVNDLKQILAARTGRERPCDVDTFEIAIGGSVLAGILHPELTPEDVKAIGRIYWRKLIKPMVRRQKRKAIHAAKKPVANAAAAAKAAAIGAAWGLQAGGHQPDPDYQPEPVNRCPFCQDGYIVLDTHLHDTTSVRCSVCLGTGEID